MFEKVVDICYEEFFFFFDHISMCLAIFLYSLFSSPKKIIIIILIINFKKIEASTNLKN